LWLEFAPETVSPKLKLQKNSEYSSRLGEPEPALVTTPVVDPLTIALRVVDAEAPGLNCL
jgi:hypothetical protein